jgi:hypothetical protein
MTIFCSSGMSRVGIAEACGPLHLTNAIAIEPAVSMGALQPDGMPCRRRAAATSKTWERLRTQNEQNRFQMPKSLTIS